MHLYDYEVGLPVAAVLLVRMFEACCSYPEAAKAMARLGKISPAALHRLLQSPADRASLVNMLSHMSLSGESHLALADLLRPPLSAAFDAGLIVRGWYVTKEFLQVAIDVGHASPTHLLLGVLDRRDSPISEENHLVLVQFLVERGADLAATSSPGLCTALHLACRDQRRAIADYLVMNGADRNCRNGAGLRATDLARGALRAALKERDPPVRRALGVLDDICTATGLRADLADLVMRHIVRHRYRSADMEGEPSLVFLYHRKRRRAGQ